MDRWALGKGHDSGCSARGGDDRGQDSRSIRPISVSPVGSEVPDLRGEQLLREGLPQPLWSRIHSSTTHTHTHIPGQDRQPSVLLPFHAESLLSPEHSKKARILEREPVKAPSAGCSKRLGFTSKLCDSGQVT